jgi:hypothetical protein
MVGTRGPEVASGGLLAAVVVAAMAVAAVAVAAVVVVMIVRWGWAGAVGAEAATVGLAANALVVACTAGAEVGGAEVVEPHAVASTTRIAAVQRGTEAFQHRPAAHMVCPVIRRTGLARHLADDTRQALGE